MTILYLLLFFLLPIATILEILLRVIFIFVYPVAFYFRNWPRKYKGLLWMALDDSIVRDSIARGAGPLEYCCYPGKEQPFGKLINKLPVGRFTEFLKSWNWGAWRNSGINLAIAIENWIGISINPLYHLGSKTSFYEIRAHKHLALPYLELHMSKVYIQCGWLMCGRFQAEFKIK